MASIQKSSGLTKITLAADPGSAEVGIPSKVNWTVAWKKCNPDAICFQPNLGNPSSFITLFPRFKVESKIVQSPSDFYRAIHLKKYFPNYMDLNYHLWNGIECNTKILVGNPYFLNVNFSFHNHRASPTNICLEWFLFNTLAAGKQAVPLKNGKGYFLQTEIGSLILHTCFDGGATFGQESIPSLTQSMLLEPNACNEFIILIGLGQTANNCQQTLSDLKGKDWNPLMAREVIHHSSSLIQIETQNPKWNELLHFSQVQALRILKEIPQLDATLEETGIPGHNLFELKHGLNITGHLLADNFKSFLSKFYVNQIELGQIHWIQPAPTQAVKGLAFPAAMEMAYQIYFQTRDLEWLRSLYPKLKMSLQAWFSRSNDKDTDGCPEWAHPSQMGIEEAILLDQYPLLFHPYHINKMENPGLLSLLYDEQCAAANLAELLGEQEDAVRWRDWAHQSLQRMDQFWQRRKKTYQVLDYEAHHNLASMIIQKGKGDSRLKLQWLQKESFRIQIIINLTEAYTRSIQISIKGSSLDKRHEEVIHYSKVIWQKDKAIALTEAIYDGLEEVQILGLRADETWVIQTLHYAYQDISMLLPFIHKKSGMKKKLAAQFHAALEKNCQLYGFPILHAHEKVMQAHCIASIPWNCLLIEKLLNYGELDSAVLLFGRIMAAVSLQLSKDSTVSSYYDCQTGLGFGAKDTLRGLIPVTLFLRLVGIQKITQEEIIITHFNPFRDQFTVQYKGIKLTLSPALVEISCRGLTDRMILPGTYRICFPPNVVK